MARPAATDPAVPRAVAARWAFDTAHLERLSGGLINQTFAVSREGQPVAVLQQLHPIFGAEVNLDLEAVTQHLASDGLVTPRLLRTDDGQAWVNDGERVWRALTWVEGRCVSSVPGPEWAVAGGALVGRFHRALSTLRYDYRFTRGNVHDTARHLAALGERISAAARDRRRIDLGPTEDATAELIEAAVELGREILTQAEALPELPAVALRHCHGDLKISNLMFRHDDPVTGLCLVDLDTLGLASMAFEIGDAMRSWCNPSGEDVVAASFDLALFEAAIRGFREVADPLLSDDERRSIVVGLATVAVELAARFCVDVFDDRYFGWNAERYRSRRHHNLVRARSQLSLARSVRAQLGDALAIVAS
jgi:Ser/Thr protein kinase RdoA (MazF antagonist)